MQPLVTAGAGFLLAVLWFDLVFDVQARRPRTGDLPEPVLNSISAYYRRVTTGARPMNRLVATMMLVTLAGIVVQLVRGDVPAWVSWLSLALALGPITLAGAHTVPSAVRLGRRADPPGTQSTIARSILRDHVFCVASIASLLAVQLVWAA